MSTVIDRPWAIVYGPKCKLGTGLMYGLGLTRDDAWRNAVLVYLGYSVADPVFQEQKASLRKRGLVAKRVEVHLP